jgi:predicted nucleic acid-binding protein
LKKEGAANVAFVLDASAALPWCFRDEATTQSNHLLEQAVTGERVYVPAQWPMEVLNGLTRASRRGRLDDPSVVMFLVTLRALAIVVEELSISEQWSEALPLIKQYRLSAYDAAYLALAKRLNIALATFDTQLRLAAYAEGVLLSI